MNYENAGNNLIYDILIKDPISGEPIDLDTIQDIVVLIQHEKTGKALARFSKLVREGYGLGTIDDPTTGIMTVELSQDITKKATPGTHLIYVKYWDSNSKPTEDQGILEEFVDSPLKNVELPQPEPEPEP